VKDDCSVYWIGNLSRDTVDLVMKNEIPGPYEELELQPPRPYPITSLTELSQNLKTYSADMYGYKQ
jgi:hypothetical protein